MRYDVMIGIDPDCKKSGFAMKENGKMNVQLLSFFPLMEMLQAVKQVCSKQGHTLMVRIEAGWLNEKSNFHSWRGQSKSVGERIAKNVGANHETGRKIVEMCEYLAIPHELVRPTHSKMTPEYFKAATGIDTRNQEKIDAGVLIL